MIVRVTLALLLCQSAACGSAAPVPAVKALATPVAIVAEEEDAGLPEPRARALQFHQLTAGDDHFCALRRNGTVFCWGNEDDEVTGPNAETGGDIVQVAAGYQDTCALRRNGSVTCWGWPLRETLPSTDYTRIEAGWQHACGLHEDGSITCWVSSRSRGTGPPFHFPGPTHGIEVDGPNADTGTGYVELALDTGTCALRADDSLTCWGEQLALGATHFARIFMGRGSICGLRRDGTVFCWGDNTYKQTTGPNSDTGPAIAHVSTGWGRTCVVRTEGTLTCWGLGAESVVDDAQTGPRATDPGWNFVQVATTARPICALRQNGVVSCWGSDTVEHHYR